MNILELVIFIAILSVVFALLESGGMWIINKIGQWLNRSSE